MMKPLGEMKQGEYFLRGKPLTEHMQEGDFFSSVWQTWVGTPPTDIQHTLIEICFIACIDHGAEPPSAHVTRVVASCGKPTADAVAAGLLTLGSRHGNVASLTAEWLKDVVGHAGDIEIHVQSMLERKQRLPGLGHPVYEIDPRAQRLISRARELLDQTPHIDCLEHASRIVSTQKGKPMPVNIDGAIGAIVADLGADSMIADAIFLCARTIGLVAHAHEEMASGESYRRG